MLVGDEPTRVAERVERLRRKIADCRFGREELPLWMTASLGFCDYPLHRELEDSFWNLSFKLADMALYRAKQEAGIAGADIAGSWGRRRDLNPEQIVAGSGCGVRRLTPASRPSGSELIAPCRERIPIK